MSEPIAEIPTGNPKRALRVYLTDAGFLYIGEYERIGRKQDFHPTTRAVQVGAEAIPLLVDALRVVEAEARASGHLGTPKAA